MTGARGGRGRRGFVLAVVVFLLFAVGMASTVAFNLVQMEWHMAAGGREALEASALARSGLERYVAERIGIPVEDSYAIGGARVTVTPQRVRRIDDRTELWYLEARASVADPRYPDDPAVRTAGMMARLHTQPVSRVAAVVASAPAVRVESSWGFFGGVIAGYDQSTPGGCASGGSEDVAAVLSRDTAVFVESGSTVVGVPGQLQVGTHDAVADLAGVRWDVLSDPSFPVAHDGSMPPWWTMAADSFPVVRHDGDLRADWSWSGRGVLIVTGAFQPYWGFWWEGIILAGSFDDRYPFTPLELRGMLVTGLNGSGEASVDFKGFTDIRYHSCNVASANRALAYLEPLENASWEAW